MKKTIYLFILISFTYVNTVLSQNIEEGFENTTCNSNDNNPFFDDCLDGWISTHGSPRLNWQAGININPYEGSNFVYMSHVFVRQDWCPGEPYRGEGTILNYNFQQGNTYKITYAIMGNNSCSECLPEDVTYEKNWVLTNGFQNNTGSLCDPGGLIPDTPLNSRFLEKDIIYNDSSWTVNEETFTIEAGEDFSQLWFRGKVLSNLSSPNIFLISNTFLDAINIEVVCEPEPITITANNENITDTLTYTLACDENERSVTFNTINLKNAQYLSLDSGVWENPQGTFNVSPTLTSFSVWVWGYDSCGDSYSKKIRVNIEQDCCKISEPVLQLDDWSTLFWDPVSGAVSYTVESFSKGCKCKYPITIGEIQTTDTSITLPSLPSDSCTLVQVRAVCSDGSISDPSNSICLVGKKFVGIKEVFVTPNPSKGAMTFNVLTSDTSGISIEVHDIYGELVKSFALNTVSEKMSSVSWDESNLKKGIYFVTFTSKNETRYSKVIVE